MMSWLIKRKQHFGDQEVMGDVRMRRLHPRYVALMPRLEHDEQQRQWWQLLHDRQLWLASQNLCHREIGRGLNQNHQVLQICHDELMHLPCSLREHHEYHHVGLGHIHQFQDLSSEHHCQQYLFQLQVCECDHANQEVLAPPLQLEVDHQLLLIVFLVQ